MSEEIDDVAKEAVNAFCQQVADVKDGMLRDALLDLMSPYVFTIVAADSLAFVGEKWGSNPITGVPTWECKGLKVFGAQMLFAEGAP